MKSTELRRRRLALKWSQTALAVLLDVSPRTVMRAENNEDGVPKLMELAFCWLELQAGVDSTNKVVYSVNLTGETTNGPKIRGLT